MFTQCISIINELAPIVFYILEEGVPICGGAYLSLADSK